MNSTTNLSSPYKLKDTITTFQVTVTEVKELIITTSKKYLGWSNLGVMVNSSRGHYYFLALMDFAFIFLLIF